MRVSQLFRTVALLMLVGEALAGEVVLDNFTVGAPLDDTALAPDSSNIFEITEGFGRTSANGATLFHSFDAFSIDTGETASFSGAPTIRNIVSRVTGGGFSIIDGTLQSTIPGAGFWFINPAGVILGPNAVLDMSGTVAIGAADFVRLDDGSLIDLDTAESDFALRVAAPESFGFFADSTAGPIFLIGFSLVEADSSIAPATNFADLGDVYLAGGGVAASASTIQTFGTGAALDAGDIFITSNGSLLLTNGSTIASGSDANAPGATPGDIRLAAVEKIQIDPGSSNKLSRIQIDTRRADGALPAQVTLAADSIELNGVGFGFDDPSLIDLIASNNARSADLTMTAATSIQIMDTKLSSQAVIPFGGIAGSINLAAGTDIEISNAIVTRTSSSSVAVPNDASITMIAGDQLLLNEAALIGRTAGVTDAGDIVLVAPFVAFEDLNDATSGTLTGISSSAIGPLGFNPDQLGAPGDIFVLGFDVSIVNAGISAATDSNRSAQPGVISIEALNSLSLIGTRMTTRASGAASASSIKLMGQNVTLRHEVLIGTFTTSEGDAGALDISGTNISLEDGVGITTSTSGHGNAGTINIAGTERVRVNFGDSGPLADSGPLKIQPVKFFALSSLNDDHDLLGSAGKISVSGGVVEIANALFTGTTFSDRLDNIVSTIDVTSQFGDLTLRNTSLQTEAFGATPAGDITINGVGVRITDGSTVLSSTVLGSGSAGYIQILGGESVTIDGSGVQANTFGGGGQAGVIEVRSDGPISISGAAQIETSTIGFGQAGVVALLSEADITVSDGARIETSTEASGDAGDILFITPGTVSITGASTSISSSTAAAGAGGAILFGDLSGRLGPIGPVGTLSITNGASVTAGASGTGPGGNISATLTGALDMNRGEITTSAESDTASGGAINLTMDSGIVQRNSLIQTRATGTGNGGVINIAVTGADQLFLVDTTSLISADSAGGTSGTVTISVPDPDIDAAVKPQDVAIIADPTLAANVCSPRGRESQSSFVVLNRGGVPEAPDAYLSAGVLVPPEDAGVAGVFLEQPQIAITSVGCR